jgi:hypothetical protein
MSLSPEKCQELIRLLEAGEGDIRAEIAGQLKAVRIYGSIWAHPAGTSPFPLVRTRIDKQRCGVLPEVHNRTFW